MKYLIIDACFGGTGIRDKYEGGYIDLSLLGLSVNFTDRLLNWINRYNNEFFNGYNNSNFITELDKEGKEIASQLKTELSNDVKVEYYSDAKLVSEIIL
jgi:hypothetical protein